MAKVSDYKDLLVWQRGMELVEEVYQVTNNLPKSEQWGLTSQSRRAAISIPSNIAEGYGRQTPGEYLHHLRIARGSIYELEPQALLMLRLKFLTPDDVERSLSKITELRKMMYGLIRRINSK